MEFTPDVHWPLARRIAALGQGSLPAPTRPELHRFVANLRIRGREAGTLAATTMQMDSHATTNIRVVDRDGWVQAASQIAEAALDTLRWPRRSAGLRRTLIAHGLGAGIGVGLGVGARRMLGQFDAFSGTAALYLVAPNLWAIEHQHRFAERPFHLWVAAHEQTHALQFERAPWLTQYLVELVGSSGSKTAVDRIIATMTFLEGHADYIADHTGNIQGVQRMRRVFRRTKRAGGLLDKGAQYANGLAFCSSIQALHTQDPVGAARAFDAAFEGPEQLPTRAEIAEPKLWDRRVHG